jgi:signal transduction histidine kinase/DNA-binding response OmpR family regulator
LAVWSVRWRARRLSGRSPDLEEKVGRESENLRLEAERQKGIAERALASVQSRVEEMRRLDEAKTRLFANISHELRTPLTLTIGPLEDLRDGLHGPLPAEIRSEIEIAIRNAHRLLHLVNQTLDVARIESGQVHVRPRRADIVAFLKGIGLSFSYMIKRNQIAFRFESPPDPLFFHFDPDLLEKIVSNLLTNAFKFTPRGGSVKLVVASDEPEGPGAVRGIRISVRDSGPGIPGAELPHVFDRFYQVSEAGHVEAGSGLGLSLAKELVELHGGRLEARSEEGFGTTFVVTLPPAGELPPGERIEAGSPETGERIASPSLDALGTGREADRSPVAGQERSEEEEPSPPEEDDLTTVLVVDDDPDMRAYLRKHLERDYRIVEAADGKEGLEEARRRLPDLIISDVIMPGLDGHSLCKSIARDRELSFFPVILLTAKAATDHKIEGLEAGADDYLGKPFEMRELQARVRNLIQSRKRLRAGPGGPKTILASPVEAHSADDLFLEDVKSIVEGNLGDEGFTVEALAESMNLSRGHLHRRLRELLKQSPSEVIRCIRLDRAAQLLRAKSGTVGEIAYGVGFKSVSHFSRSFRDRHGCSPSEFMAAEPGSSRTGPPSEGG